MVRRPPVPEGGWCVGRITCDGHEYFMVYPPTAEKVTCPHCGKTCLRTVTEVS